MIKKFKQFIKENREKDIVDILSPEEIEDQFLRLKEILNCSIDIMYEDGKDWIDCKNSKMRPYSKIKKYVVSLIPPLPKDEEGKISRNCDIEEEYQKIKNRMSSQYPNIKFSENPNEKSFGFLLMEPTYISISIK